MSEEPKKTDTDSEETEKPTEVEEIDEAADLAIVILMNIPGVGPKTAEKLVEVGYDQLDKVVTADSQELAAAVPGLSVSKAEDVITAATSLKADIESGVVDITGKAKKSKRKKAVEPDPETHELPLADAAAEAEVRTSLRTGLDDEKESKGIPAGPQWLTKFERARIVGARALQISMGAPVLIDMKTAPKGLFALAEAELKSKRLPMTVRRTTPTGEYFDIALVLLLKATRLD
ncbi:MAG: DNA-directed RNA polymerase subunit K [Candidatus Thorarchaeota archaeon]